MYSLAWLFEKQGQGGRLKKGGAKAKKIDYYRGLGIPMSYLRAGVQSLIMN